MTRKIWGRLVAVPLLAVALSGGSVAAAEEVDRVPGSETAPAATVVPLPDLVIAHRLAQGGMNLWRMPLSELEAGHWQPELVTGLDFGGFSYDNSVSLAADFGDVTPSDDGTADHLIWHRQPNGGVLVWAVGGGSDATPRLWHDLRTGGWSYADSQPLVGDVTGDGWDDLVVVHRNYVNGGVNSNVWVFPNNGFRLSAPQLWATLPHPPARYFLGDVLSDGVEDLVEVTMAFNFSTRQRDVTYAAHQSSGSSISFGAQYVFQGPTSAGWSMSASRQLAGDVTGDGRTDIVTIHAQPNGGILAWVHRNCGVMCFAPPQVWQDLRTGGWSYAGSRQHLADTDGDGVDDLVSVHSQAGNPGMLVWRHVSSGGGFRVPQVMANLMAGGWSYSRSRDGVARTYGVW